MTYKLLKPHTSANLIMYYKNAFILHKKTQECVLRVK